MVNNNCSVKYAFVSALPSNLCAHTIYFVKSEGVVSMYITDANSIPYLISSEGSGGGVSSPNGTILVTDGRYIDVSQTVLNSIISLHNSFPDLQGGTTGEYFHLDQIQYTYVTDMVANDTLGNLYSLINLLATPPTYTLPISSLSGSSGTYEVGSSLSVSITQSFTQNDGGAKQLEQIKKNGTTVSSSNIFTETLIVPFGNTTYSGSVSYAQGACKTNNLGIVDCNGRVEAGQTTSPDRIVTGGYRRYAGNVTTLPTTGAEVRSQLLGTSVVNTANTFSFTTGTTNRRFVIAIPSTKTLVSVVNTGTNENLTFTLSSSITTVPDAAGVNVSYKVYTLENAVPFSTNYTLNVTLS